MAPISTGRCSFTDLQIDPAAVAGRTLPVLSGSGDATLKDGVAAGRTRSRSLRGQSGTIRNLDLSTGPETGIALSGPFTVGADGLIDANLMVTLRDPRGVAAALANAFPEARRQITAGFAGLAALGNAALAAVEDYERQGRAWLYPTRRNSASLTFFTRSRTKNRCPLFWNCVTLCSCAIPDENRCPLFLELR